MKTRGEGEKRVLSFFPLFLFFFAAASIAAAERTIARSKRIEKNGKVFYCRELKKKKRETKKTNEESKERREKREKKGGRKKKIKFKRFPIEIRAKRKSLPPMHSPMHGNMHDKKFINFVLVFSSWGVLVDAAVEEVVRRRVPLHTHGKAGPVGGAPFHLFERRENDSSKRTLYRFFTRGQVRPVEGFTAHRHKGEC